MRAQEETGLIMNIQTISATSIMKRTLCITSNVLLTLTLSATEHQAPLTAEKVLEQLAAKESARNKILPSYKVVRVYNLNVEKKPKQVTSMVEFQYRSLGGKTYRILDEKGAEGLLRMALHKVMQAEVKATQSEKEVAVSPENYEATLLGTEEKDGRLCYVLSVIPKRKSKYLLKGKAWVDAKEFGLVRMEGYPTESLSFWIGKPFIEQSFANIGGHWLMQSNKSIVEAKLVGHLELTINSKAYVLSPAEVMQTTASRIAPGYPVTSK